MLQMMKKKIFYYFHWSKNLQKRVHKNAKEKFCFGEILKKETKMAYIII